MTDFLMQFLAENFAVILGPIFMLMIGAMILQNATKKWHTDIEPDLTPKEVESGRYELEETSDWESLLLPSLLGLVCLGLFAVTLPAILSGDVALLLLIGLFLTLLLGLGMGIKMFKRLLVLVRMRPGKLFLSKWPLKLGEQVTVTYQRDFFGKLNITDITPRLICQCEVYLIQSGNKSNTYTVKVYRDEISAFSLGGTQGRYEQEFTVNLPKYAPPSFERPHHKYRWFLEVDLEIESFPDTTSSFELHVTPEMPKGDS